METALTPEDYPARCDTDAEGLATLKDRFDDPDDDFGQYLDDEWPPRDSCGNVYPIFFEPDDLDGYGKLRDENGHSYNPFCGNLEPYDPNHRVACNAPLQSWRIRYPQIRYCGRRTAAKDDDGETIAYTYCPNHKGIDNMKTAEEHLQTGMYVKSVDHLYEQLSPWKKLLGWGTFESLLGESNYEYAVEYEQRTFDFSDEDFAPDGVDEDGNLTVKCGYPTQYPDRALSLFTAAMKTVQMIGVQPTIMYEDREEGQGMMESRTIETAQLTAPTEANPHQEWRTKESWSEHHLNLPLSRLISDRPKLLEYGGVDTDVTDAESGPSEEDIVLEIDADAETVETTDDTGTDPNSFGEDYTPESERIAHRASQDDETVTSSSDDDGGD